jgi:hypothetical protein
LTSSLTSVQNFFASFSANTSVAFYSNSMSRTVFFGLGFSSCGGSNVYQSLIVSSFEAFRTSFAFGGDSVIFKIIHNKVFKCYIAYLTDGKCLDRKRPTAQHETSLLHVSTSRSQKLKPTPHFAVQVVQTPKSGIRNKTPSGETIILLIGERRTWVRTRLSKIESA